MNDQKPNPKQVIAAYFRNFENGPEDEDFWSWQYIWELVLHDPELAWKIILGLVAAAPSSDALGYVGADCLEDLLMYHGTEFIDRIRIEAARDKRFLAALYSARVSETDAVFKQLMELKRELGINERGPELPQDLFATK
jgi:hypothetical protein